jgi:hypothetical protein
MKPEHYCSVKCENGTIFITWVDYYMNIKTTADTDIYKLFLREELGQPIEEPVYNW